jgi:hypothetical protein
MLDALHGWNEAESERRKVQAELVRKSTWLLWNLQVAEEYKGITCEEMWRFPWEEKEEEIKPDEKDPQQMELEERQKEFLLNKYPD